MSDRTDDGRSLDREDEAFVRNVADLYAAPPMTASQRTRFDARLEERIRDSALRRWPWLAVTASVAAVLSLLVWHTRIDVSSGVEAAQVGVSMPTRIETNASGDDWILAMTTETLSDSDDTLPPDYLAISDLLLDN
jgi:hypothetical protein